MTCSKTRLRKLPGRTPLDARPTQSGGLLSEGSSVATTGWPLDAARSLGLSHSSGAIGGNTFKDMASQIDALRVMDPDFVVLFGGVSSIKTDTAADAYADLKAWVLAAREVSTASLWLLTSPPSFGTGAMYTTLWNANITSELPALNTLMVANEAGFDGVIDISGEPDLQVGASGRDGDGIHYSAFGDSVISGRVSAAIAASRPEQSLAITATT